MIVRRRGMPLIRGALIGGLAYGVGRRVTTSTQREQQQSADEPPLAAMRNLVD